MEIHIFKQQVYCVFAVIDKSFAMNTIQLYMAVVNDVDKRYDSNLKNMPCIIGNLMCKAATTILYCTCIFRQYVLIQKPGKSTLGCENSENTVKINICVFAEQDLCNRCYQDDFKCEVNPFIAITSSIDNLHVHVHEH